MDKKVRISTAILIITSIGAALVGLLTNLLAAQITSFSNITIFASIAFAFLGIIFALIVYFQQRSAFQQKQLINETSQNSAKSEEELEEFKQHIKIENQKLEVELKEKQLTLEKTRLDLKERQLELEKERLASTLELANRLVETLKPEASEAEKTSYISALLSDLLKLAGGPGLEISKVEEKAKEIRSEEIKDR